jgi:hypothetical protein
MWCPRSRKAGKECSPCRKARVIVRNINEPPEGRSKPDRGGGKAKTTRTASGQKPLACERGTVFFDKPQNVTIYEKAKSRRTVVKNAS